MKSRVELILISSLMIEFGLCAYDSLDLSSGCWNGEYILEMGSSSSWLPDPLKITAFGPLDCTLIVPENNNLLMTVKKLDLINYYNNEIVYDQEECLRNATENVVVSFINPRIGSDRVISYCYSGDIDSECPCSSSSTCQCPDYLFEDDTFDVVTVFTPQVIG